MATNRIGAQIESLIRKSQWQQAQKIIEKQLDKEPDDHWLWARLSGVKYERRQYEAALRAAENALAIVPDCPLALWSKAGALEMLGKGSEAMRVYVNLFRRGLEQLQSPDSDANECWEGPEWTSGLVADCLFHIAGRLAKSQPTAAIETYQAFLRLLDFGIPSIYSRDDALARLNKLVPSKNARREAAMRNMVKMETVSPR